MGKLKLLVRIVLSLVAVLVLLYLAGIIPVLEVRYRPSGQAAYIPETDVSFSSYLAENRTRIRAVLEETYFTDNDQPFGPAYSLNDVLDKRAPFQFPADGNVCDDPARGGGRGFLLMHGLTDSPYLVKTVARELADAYPCALIRGLLSPGHGTVPGDLLNVRVDDWKRIARYGIESFRGEVDELFLVGYSNGSSLAIEYIANQRQDPLIQALILLSPGLRAADTRTYLTPWLRHVARWINRHPDVDAVKYESFPTNAAAEFYKLTREVTAIDLEPVSLPVFMVMSSDDTTVDNSAAVDFFCNKVNHPDRKLIWYESSNTNIPPPMDCDGIRSVGVAVDNARFVSHSHVAITLPMDDAHYGLDGNYSSCLAYVDDAEKYSACNTDDDITVYAENSLRDSQGMIDGKLVRRTTFNPLFDEMMTSILCFIEQSCNDD